MGIRPRGGGVRPSVQKAGPKGPLFEGKLVSIDRFYPFGYKYSF